MSNGDKIAVASTVFCLGFVIGAILSILITINYQNDYWLKKLEYHGYAKWDEKRSVYIPVWETVKTSEPITDTLQ